MVILTGDGVVCQGLISLVPRHEQCIGEVDGALGVTDKCNINF